MVINQVMNGGFTEAVCERLSLSEKLIASSERLLSVVGSVIEVGVVGSWFLKHRRQNMQESQFDVAYKLSLSQKDLLIGKLLARDLDIPLPTVEVTVRDFRVLAELGDGCHEISGWVRHEHSPDQ